MTLYRYFLFCSGLPKAAMVTHERVWAASFIQAVVGVTADDIFYINLPLYHSAGFLIGMAGGIERGNVISSVATYWCCPPHVTAVYPVSSPKKLG